MKKKPNILFIFSDQHQAQIMGCAGNDLVITPNLDALAQKGTICHRAYCQMGICQPSRTSLFTGQYCRTLGVLDNGHAIRHPERFTSLFELLHNDGYYMASYGKRHLCSHIDHFWNDEASHHSCDASSLYYKDWVAQRGQLAEYERDWHAEFGGGKVPLTCQLSTLLPENTMEAFTAQKTIEFLRSDQAKQGPFFCWSSFYRPHQPYTPVKKYLEMYQGKKLKFPDSFTEPIENLPPFMQQFRKQMNGTWCMGRKEDKQLWENYLLYYYALVTEIDDHIGSILTVLKEEGLDDDTIIIYTADHGDFLCSHGMAEKIAWGHNVYESTIRVPLIFYWPGRIKARIESHDLVELVDVYPTLAQFCDMTLPEHLPGLSLVEHLTKGKKVERRYAMTESQIQITAIGKRYKYGKWLYPEKMQGYPDMLFDRIDDPEEMNNLIKSPTYASIRREMNDYISRWITVTPLQEPLRDGPGKTMMKAPGYV